MSPRAMRYGLLFAAITWIALCTGTCVLLWVTR